MASIIDNREKTMLESLKNSLNQAENVDILTAFFYFSGFNALAKELSNKKLRILVGNTLDPNAIEELCRAVKEIQEEVLDTYAVRGYNRLNNSQKKDYYISSFIELFNKSSLSEEFDSTESQVIFKMFISKIKDGSLEIRLTGSQNHAKAYILTNKPEYSFFGDQKGVVFTGSSNFTFNGLLGQGEMNERFSDNTKYEEYKGKFDELWNDGKSIDISVLNGNDEFTKELEKRLWIFSKPSPYHIYLRVLYELFNTLNTHDVHTPYDITRGKFLNLRYQIDAVKLGIDSLEKNNGVIIADVVGLGKSIIASAIAYNLDMQKCVVIAPPHLVEQWNDYQQDFGLRGVKIYSSGKVEEVYKNHADNADPILYIIDEAHRYRNELSNDYQMLHQITRSNPGNKVILLTATPYNNRPTDLFALIKLFQTPSRSTINSVDNLGVKFRELIATYNKLAKEGKKNLSPEIRNELTNLSNELRILIDPVIVRRSRIDLKEIKEYADDLRVQGVKFPQVIGPELVEFDLGGLRDLYLDTLDKLSNDFTSSRYNPSAYLKNPSAFNEKYGELFGEMNIQLFQGNLAQFIRRLLVMRFESSKAAFKSTLSSLLSSYENIKKWWEKGYVPIKKSGYLSDPDEDEIQETLDLLNGEDEDYVLDLDKLKKKAIPFEKELFNDNYISAVENDIALLKDLYRKWFYDDAVGIDPKYKQVTLNIDYLLEQNPNRKIVVFSSFADTAEYVSNQLNKDGYRSILYTGSASTRDRYIVKANFDASLKLSEQRNDYDIIVATDALSEGFNLNRAGVIINYDIPYNPTRVVQRIGRINRINKMMFDKIYIYNFFPTDIGESNTLIKGISTLKMLLINKIVGSDTKTLTPDEPLQSYFRRQYEEAGKDQNEKSWDVDYKNVFDSFKHNSSIIEEIKKIPERVRVVRLNNIEPCVISFAKRGNNTLFAIAFPNGDAKVLPVDYVLRHFKADPKEKSYDSDPDLDLRFKFLRDEIKRPHTKVRLDKRRGQALENLEKIIVACPAEKDYLNDLKEIIATFDDLSDGELKYLSMLRISRQSAPDLSKEIKNKIPAHYIIQIKKKVESIDAQTETIMFTEDLRNDNN